MQRRESTGALTRWAILPVLLAAALFCAAVAAGGVRELTLFDAPRGAWLGTVREDASVVVLEERDGWRRVRLEAWMAGSAPDTPEGPKTPATEKPREPATGVIQGVLAPPIGSGGSMGSGVLVLLVRESGPLDEEHRKAGAECRARLQKADQSLETLQAEINQALNSSDNFREAASRNDRLKAQQAREKRERSDLIRDCRARALALFEPSVAQRAVSDGSGRFEFLRVPAGRFRVVAFESAGETPRSWSFSFEMPEGGSRVLDPIADNSPVAADWNLR